MVETKVSNCFVFARGGSKGLPGKNLLPINGVPLIGHSIETAKKINQINRIFVSTDSEEIAEVGKLFGAEVIERPKDLASDTASEWEAWKHAIEHVGKKYGDFDQFISLPATAPCRRYIDVRRCMQALVDDVDMVITTTDSHRNPWFNMVTNNSEGYAQLVNTSQGFKRRQDSPKCQDMATVAYIARPSFINNNESIWDGNVKAIKVPQHTAVDIDTFYDYSVAKMLMENPGIMEKLNGLAQ
jgi:CMP-N-acetylneuraminic acid synthetase